MTDKYDDSTLQDGRALLKALSPQDFLAFGVNHLAYITPINASHMGGSHLVYALRSANGETLMVAETPALAAAAARQHDMDAVVVH